MHNCISPLQLVNRVYIVTTQMVARPTVCRERHPFHRRHIMRCCSCDLGHVSNKLAAQSRDAHAASGSCHSMFTLLCLSVQFIVCCRAVDAGKWLHAGWWCKVCCWSASTESTGSDRHVQQQRWERHWWWNHVCSCLPVVSLLCTTCFLSSTPAL